MDRSLADTRALLQDRLVAAMRARDAAATAAVRSVLAALANAEAVPVPPDTTSTAAATSEHVAGARLGVGAAEAPRALLTSENVRAVIRNEYDERVAAAAELSRLGQDDRAARLRVEADVLQPFLSR